MSVSVAVVMSKLVTGGPTKVVIMLVFVEVTKTVDTLEAFGVHPGHGEPVPFCSWDAATVGEGSMSLLRILLPSWTTGAWPILRPSYSLIGRGGTAVGSMACSPSFRSEKGSRSLSFQS